MSQGAGSRACDLREVTRMPVSLSLRVHMWMRRAPTTSGCCEDEVSRRTLTGGSLCARHVEGLPRILSLNLHVTL